MPLFLLYYLYLKPLISLKRGMASSAQDGLWHGLDPETAARNWRHSSTNPSKTSSKASAIAAPSFIPLA